MKAEARTDSDGRMPLQRVMQLLGLSRSALTRLVAAGFVSPVRGPRNQQFFAFNDLVILKAAHALRAANIPPRRILRSISKLRESLPGTSTLSGLKLSAVGAQVAVREQGLQWDAESGQLLIDFEVDPQSGDVLLLGAPNEGAMEARQSVSRAVAVERLDRAAAEVLYRKAIELAPGLADAYINLGALLCESGRCADAVALLEAARVHCDNEPLIHFNLAIAQEDLGNAEAAKESYRRTVDLSPSLADAHFNLARLLEVDGDARGTLRHYSAYRRLVALDEQ
jgi:tetratricopeptide (TPR) repeat protein